MRGVNLGGWLVAEHLTTPELFKGVLGRDEAAIIEELGQAGKDRLKKHHETYITEADFKWLAEHGINSIRLPVPHWVFGDAEPYIGCLKALDFAMDIAKKHKLKVLLDLHTAPGSQNGNDHSGKTGPIRWHTGAGNIAETVEVIEKLGLRYGKYENLWGIELLNEPSPKIPRATLQEYYKQAYQKIRQVSDPNIKIVMSDAFQPTAWAAFFQENDFDNVALDIHLYHVFDKEDKKLDIHKQLKKVLNRRDMIAEVQTYVPVLIGEWSLGLSRAALSGLDAWEADKARQAFGRLQLNTYQKTLGWFFWTYKTEDPGGWSFRYCVEKGWLPPDFSAPVTIETPV